MSNIRFTPPTPEQRRNILAEYGIKFDRRIRENECFEITSLFPFHSLVYGERR